ncbi:protein of unknown function [Methanoculleus bourgensis]|uniref:Uncharacterized protein n=1 Tax=Methanoculleus bourgensis TaxID=83986 RepID=A0A0X8Y093_9EURY|nr:protein of unknown function [Methanoculleus bourgensis]
MNPRPPGYEPGALTGLSYGPQNNRLSTRDMEAPHIAAFSRIPGISGAYKHLPFTINTLCGPISGLLRRTTPPSRLGRPPG